MVVTRIIHRYCNRAKFVYNNHVPADDMDELYDMLKAKYAINSTIELSNYVSGKMHIIVEAERKLNICRPCRGIRFLCPATFWLCFWHPMYLTFPLQNS
jgi:hypothetical protein